MADAPGDFADPGQMSGKRWGKPAWPAPASWRKSRRWRCDARWVTASDGEAFQVQLHRAAWQASVQ
jgi:hypothetical protein